MEIDALPASTPVYFAQYGGRAGSRTSEVNYIFDAVNRHCNACNVGDELYKAVLANREAWLICDNAEFTRSEAPRVLFVSSGDQNNVDWNIVVKEPSADYFYMPLWTWSEICNALRVHGGEQHLTVSIEPVEEPGGKPRITTIAALKDCMKERYQWWGGMRVLFRFLHIFILFFFSFS